MQAMDDVLEEFVQSNVIDGEDAYMKSLEKKRFEQYLPQDSAIGVGG